MTNKELKEDLWDKVSNWTIQEYGCELEQIDPNNQIFETGDIEYDEDQIQNVINIITEERFNYEWKIKNLYDEIEKLKLKLNNNDKI
tara:strand:+ start:631 stop:891 length:261 start_codon:yes stop_codon:yes gene_type:complete